MSDDAHGPEAAGEAAAGEPGASPDKGPTTSLDKGDRKASSGDPRAAVPGGSEPRPAPDPWAPPVAGAQGAYGASGGQASGGPGHTLASDVSPAWPAPSVHDQQTVAALPSEPRDAVPSPPSWVNPSVAPNPAALSQGSAANPFAPPTASVPYGAQGELVPPPPIAPGGPGPVPYGYPGPGGHGYPPGPGPVPGHGAAGYYGWPGMQPMPSNGMGTAGLVLGIISAVIFCLWPVAIVVGVLAVIFGAIGRGKARRGEATNPGQALAGIICGAAGVVLGVGMVALLIVAP